MQLCFEILSLLKYFGTIIFVFGLHLLEMKILFAQPASRTCLLCLLFPLLLRMPYAKK